MLKVEKPFVDAMRQATRLVRTQGARAATQFLQDLFRPRAPTADRSGAAEVLDPVVLDPVVLDPVEVSDPVVGRARPAGGLTELPQASGQFISARFSGEAGARSYKLYVPSGFVGAPMPLLMMLHGCTQDPDDFALGTRANRWAEARGFLVAYPQQVQRANAHRCWNWFRPQDQQPGRGEAAIIAGIARQVMDKYRVDARRVYVAGLSAGGAMADVVGQAYPELFAAIGVHSGLPAGIAQNVAAALELMRTGNSAVMQYTKPLASASPRADRRAVPMIVLHGDSDRTVHPLNAQHLIEQSTDAYRLAGNTPLRPAVETGEQNADHYAYRRTRHVAESGVSMIEQWEVRGAGHAWSGGAQGGSHTDTRGPDASQALFDFFAQHTLEGSPTVSAMDSVGPS